MSDLGALPSVPASTTAAMPGQPRRSRAFGAVWPIVASLVVFVVVWQLVVMLSGLPPYILPGPLVVAQRFFKAWTDGTMWPHVACVTSDQRGGTHHG